MLIIILATGAVRHFNLNSEKSLAAAERCKSYCENQGWRLVSTDGRIWQYVE